MKWCSLSSTSLSFPLVETWACMPLWKHQNGKICLYVRNSLSMETRKMFKQSEFLKIFGIISWCCGKELWRKLPEQAGDLASWRVGERSPWWTDLGLQGEWGMNPTLFGLCYNYPLKAQKHLGTEIPYVSDVLEKSQKSTLSGQRQNEHKSPGWKLQFPEACGITQFFQNAVSLLTPQAPHRRN